MDKFELDYDELVFLDAEDLAEAGIKDAYEELKPLLKKYVPIPVEISEEIDNDTETYRVACAGISYHIYCADDEMTDDAGESWGRATHALFDIVNRQLEGFEVKLYAINGGNDLGGLLLTQEQAEGAKNALERPDDWPYLPTLEPPWYGQGH